MPNPEISLHTESELIHYLPNVLQLDFEVYWGNLLDLGTLLHHQFATSIHRKKHQGHQLRSFTLGTFHSVWFSFICDETEQIAHFTTSSKVSALKSWRPVHGAWSWGRGQTGLLATNLLYTSQTVTRNCASIRPKQLLLPIVHDKFLVHILSDCCWTNKAIHFEKLKQLGTCIRMLRHPHHLSPV